MLRTMKSATIVLLATFILFLIRPSNAASQSSSQTGASSSFSQPSRLIRKPPLTAYAAVARWACARARFGTLSTVSLRLNKTAWGNVAAVSDGIHSDVEGHQGTGTPYLYLTELDPTARNLKADPRASFTISQATFPDAGYCREKSAQDPTCVRLTLSGRVVPVAKSTKEHVFGMKSLYSKHPSMETWPKDHSFTLYAMRVDDVFMLDNYGGSHRITLDQYYNGTLAFSISIRGSEATTL